MKRIREILLQFLLACAGIVLIGALPSILGAKSGNYFETIKNILLGIIHFQDLEISMGREVITVYPNIIEPISYSFTLLFVALLVAYFVATIFTVFTMILPPKIRERIKLSILALEALPDILVIILLQQLVIYIFKKTDFLMMKVVTLGDERAYMLPIISLAMIPMIQLYRMSILLFEEEIEKDYTELSRSKGLKLSYILVVHILRNATVRLFFQSKKTIWYMLSALVAVELLYGISGITFYLTRFMVPEIFTVVLLSFFVPIFIFYHFTKWLLEISVNKGEPIA